MNAKRTVDVFSARCPACQAAIELIKRVACSSCEVTVLDMNDISIAKRARNFGAPRCLAVISQ
jgi:glutaredoxin 3